MNRPTDLVDMREKLQEMFRDASRPSPVSVGKLFVVMTDGPPNIVHLGPDGTNRSACGMETDADHVSAEHNDITCPLCFAIHEAECAKGDDESGYFEQDVDSILETDAFMDDCVRSIMHRLAFKGSQK